MAILDQNKAPSVDAHVGICATTSVDTSANGDISSPLYLHLSDIPGAMLVYVPSNGIGCSVMCA